MQLLNLDNWGTPIEFEGTKYISTFKTLIETLENSDFIKEILIKIDRKIYFV